MPTVLAPSGWGRHLWWPLVVVLYVALALLGRELGVFDALSVWFPAAGLALALGFLRGWSALPWMAAAEFISGILVFGIQDSFTLPQMLLNALGYTAIYVGIGWALRRGGLSPRIDDVNSGVAMILAGAFAAMLAAVFGVAMQTWAGFADASQFGTNAWRWWLGDSTGILTILPALLVLALVTGADGTPRVPAALRRTHHLATAATILSPTAIAIVLLPIAGESIGAIFFVFVPMAVVAIRQGVAGTALGILAFSPTVTLLANRYAGTLGPDRTDLQLLLLGLMAAAFLIGLSADERENLQAMVQRRERHLAEAQVLSSMGSFRYDVASDVSTWSEGLYRIYGRDPDSGHVDFATYLSGIHPDDRDRVGDAVTGLLHAPAAVRHEYRMIRDDDGSQRWVEARIESTANAHGEVDTIVGTCQDITMRREAEEATRLAVRRERAAAEGIAQAERVKDALLVAVSHEVRTPLTILYGIADTLQRPEVHADPAMVERLSARLDQNVQRLQSMLDDLLDTGRLVRGAVRAQREPTSLPTLVAQRLDDVDVQHRDVQVDVTEVPVLVDRALVARIVDHLVTNAVRYTSADDPMWIRTEEVEHDLVLAVEDAGPGVPTAHVEEIFQPFQHGRRLDHAPGAGLGLFLVARFAELHGGRAWVEDRPGGGASFRVRLADALAPVGSDALGGPYRMAPGV